MGVDAGQVSVLASGRLVQGEDGGESSAQCRRSRIISWSLGLQVMAECVWAAGPGRGPSPLRWQFSLLSASQEVVEKRRLWAEEEG